MDFITGVVLLLAALLLAAAAVLVGRYLTSRGRRAPRAWIERSGADRRRHRVPVTFERRTGPRRQEDIARLFLAGMSA